MCSSDLEFNRGQCPPIDTVPALAVGAGLLGPGYFQDLVFINQPVPLIVSTDADGYTKLSWELGGWPGDVELFFDQVHQRGRAAGNTLAELLDQRPPGTRDTQPEAGSLPSVINPLAFLCQNVLRNNFFLVRVKTSSQAGLGLDSAKEFRKIVPPGTGMIVLIELAYDADNITMDAAGTDTSPGYEEAVQAYLGQAIAETVTPSMVSESVTLRQISGHCV